MKPTRTNDLNTIGVTRRSKIRDRIEAVYQIFEVANNSCATKKNKIMYKGNLSYTQFEEYILFLNERKLRRYYLDTQSFKATEKGIGLPKAHNRKNYTKMQK